MLRAIQKAVVFLLIVSTAANGPAADWYCDPVNGSSKGDGTAANPWGALQSALGNAKSPLRSGDTIRLMSGDHGAVRISSTLSSVTIEAADRQKPTLSQLSGGPGLKNWTFRNLTVQTPDAVLPDWTIVFRLTDVEGVTVEGCSIRTAADPATWGDAEWQKRCPFYGLWLRGTDLTVSKCYLTGLENCVYVEGSRIGVLNNTIEYFINDGIEYTASDLRIAGNRITDLYDLKSNKFHHDGMQGWNFDDVDLRNVLIENNYVAFSTNRFKAIPPLSSATFQGIVSFDGRFKDVIIRRNVVLSTAFHGITGYGYSDSIIESNTVSYQGTGAEPCWIGLFASPANVMVRDNIAPSYNLPKDGALTANNFAFTKAQNTWDKLTIVKPESTFVKYLPATAEFDFTVVDDSPAAGKFIRIGGAGAKQ